MGSNIFLFRSNLWRSYFHTYMNINKTVECVFHVTYRYSAANSRNVSPFGIFVFKTQQHKHTESLNIWTVRNKNWTWNEHINKRDINESHDNISKCTSIVRLSNVPLNKTPILGLVFIPNGSVHTSIALFWISCTRERFCIFMTAHAHSLLAFFSHILSARFPFFSTLFFIRMFNVCNDFVLIFFFSIIFCCDCCEYEKTTHLHTLVCKICRFVLICILASCIRWSVTYCWIFQFHYLNFVWMQSKTTFAQFFIFFFFAVISRSTSIYHCFPCKHKRNADDFSLPIAVT